MKYLNETGLAYLWNNKLKPKFTELTNKTDQLSNPNLLINGDFQVWQEGTEGRTIKNSKQYLLDGWLFNTTTDDSRVVLTKLNKGMNLVSYGTTNMIQHIEIDLRGEKTTLSMKYKLNDVTKEFKHTFNELSTTLQEVNIENGITVYLWFRESSNTTSIQFDILNKNMDIEYIKLEQGTVATPLVHRSYAEELAICQRYYYRLTKQVANGNIYRNSIYGLIPIPVTMRITPTITVNNYQMLVDGLMNTPISYADEIIMGSNCVYARFIFTGSLSDTLDGKCGRVIPSNDTGCVILDARIY